MPRGSREKAEPTIRHIVDWALNSGKLRRSQHIRLTLEMLSGKNISEIEQREINRIFDYIQAGRIKLID